LDKIPAVVMKQDSDTDIKTTFFLAILPIKLLLQC